MSGKNLPGENPELVVIASKHWSGTYASKVTNRPIVGLSKQSATTGAPIAQTATNGWFPIQYAAIAKPSAAENKGQ
jgi:hypothetical protein